MKIGDAFQNDGTRGLMDGSTSDEASAMTSYTLRGGDAGRGMGGATTTHA
jgi:hypothetical protein